MPVGNRAEQARVSFAQRFAELDCWLQQHQQLWRPKPFTQLTLEWEADYPELSGWLRQRTLAEAEAAHHQPQLLSAPAPFTQLAAEAQEFCRLPRWQGDSTGHLPEPLYRHVPGRKWQQITEFAYATTARFDQPTVRWVDLGPSAGAKFAELYEVLHVAGQFLSCTCLHLH